MRSVRDGKNYVGMTNDLRKRLSWHNPGKVQSTLLRRPLEVIYYEAHHNKYDAAARERFLKSGWGKNWIKRTLANLFRFTGKLGGRAGVVQQ